MFKRISNKSILQIFLLLGVISMCAGDLIISHLKSSKSTTIKVGNAVITEQDIKIAMHKLADKMLGYPAETIRVMTIKTLIEETMLSEEANQIGLVVSDKMLKKELSKIKDFTEEGKFNVLKYKETLKQYNIPEEKFIDKMKNEILKKQLLRFFEYTIVPQETVDMLTPALVNTKTIQLYKYKIPEIQITEEEIAKFINEMKVDTNIPERRKVEYILIESSEIPTDKITHAEIEEFYNQNKEMFFVAEKRDIAQIVFKDYDSALKAYDDIRLKPAISIAELKKKYTASLLLDAAPLLEKVNKETFEQYQILNEKLFSSSVNEYIGPFSTPIGWHIFLIQKIYQAQYEDINSPAVITKAAEAIRKNKQLIAIDKISEELENSQLSDLTSISKRYNKQIKFDVLTQKTPNKIVEEVLLSEIQNFNAVKTYQLVTDQEVADAAFQLKNNKAVDIIEIVNDDAHKTIYVIRVSDIMRAKRLSFEEIKKIADKIIRKYKRLAFGIEKISPFHACIQGNISNLYYQKRLNSSSATIQEIHSKCLQQSDIKSSITKQKIIIDKLDNQTNIDNTIVESLQHLSVPEPVTKLVLCAENEICFASLESIRYPSIQSYNLIQTSEFYSKVKHMYDSIIYYEYLAHLRQKYGIKNYTTY
ncbi:SurA N-terminal domain-containing protein [Candidatus Fokinia solitaria]|nr:SurA N-terminal domain-containing protein [Candidatus Fokinia solitaria]